jgi:hypothetical protein
MFPKELSLTCLSFHLSGAHPLPQFQQYHYEDSLKTFISSSDLLKQPAGNLPLDIVQVS